MKTYILLTLLSTTLVTQASTQKHPQTTQQITQYGITWTFDKKYPTGQFVNGDHWVVGPLTILHVSPQPAPSNTDKTTQQKSIYGASALTHDTRMRNGSMIIEGPQYGPKDPTGYDTQGYDSRPTNYNPSRTITYPLTLKTNRSLLSSISSEQYKDGKLATPYILGQKKIFLCPPQKPLALHTIAILTCLPKAPPPDAFRPAYVGTTKTIYRAKNIQWSLLPNLPKLKTTPHIDTLQRLLQRPWIDHISSWQTQYTSPGQNGPNYGREFARISSLTALTLLQDLPLQQKKPLMLHYLQLGIDLHGLAQNQRQWFSDGGHWQGRKWPILFASLMLNEKKLHTFPPLDPTKAIYGPARITPSPAMPHPTTLFQEDLDYYYSKSQGKQKALWQIIWHTGPQSPKMQSYHFNNIGASAGVALAAQLMGAKALWNNEAFFDHINHWINTTTGKTPTWLPKTVTRVYDPFIQDMWKTYQKNIPQQSPGKTNLKWIWKHGNTGTWENTLKN